MMVSHPGAVSLDLTHNCTQTHKDVLDTPSVRSVRRDHGTTEGRKCSDLFSDIERIYTCPRWRSTWLLRITM